MFNLGASAGGTADGLLSIRGFVNNALDTTYANSINSTSGNNIRFYNDPRMAGVRVRIETGERGPRRLEQYRVGRSRPRTSP